jgi:hypothetical protein
MRRSPGSEVKNEGQGELGEANMKEEEGKY